MKGDDDRGGPGVVLWRDLAGGAGPNKFAGLFVIGEETVGRGTIGAPIRVDGVADEQITLDDGRADLGIGEGHAARFFHERLFPNHLAIKIGAQEHAVGGEDIDTLQFHIHHRRAEGVTVIDDVGDEILEDDFPEFFAGLFIQAGQRFHKIRTFAAVAKAEDLAVRDHGSAAAAGFISPDWSLNEEAATVVLHAFAHLERTTPAGPIVIFVGAHRMRSVRSRGRSRSDGLGSRNSSHFNRLRSWSRAFRLGWGSRSLGLGGGRRRWRLRLRRWRGSRSFGLRQQGWSGSFSFGGRGWGGCFSRFRRACLGFWGLGGTTGDQTSERESDEEAEEIQHGGIAEMGVAAGREVNTGALKSSTKTTVLTPLPGPRGSTERPVTKSSIKREAAFI